VPNSPAAPGRVAVRHPSAPGAVVAARTSWRQDHARDPLIVFQIYLALLIFSPSIYIVPGLGAAGTPATIFGCVILILWAIGRTANPRGDVGHTPMHWVVGLFGFAMLLSFCAAMLRPLSATELASSLRGVLTLASGAGVILFAADSMRTRARLDAFLRFVVLAAFLLATMGLIQFISGVNFVELFHIPGLVANDDLVGLYERSGFTRVAGTAVHSIEFAAVVGMALPVAAHLAVNATRHRWWRWTQFLVCLIALPLTVSRSGAVALIVGALFAFGIARKRQRLLFLILLPFAGLAFRLLVPGMLGTIRSLFTSASQDISITGRVGDYEAVAQFFSQSPWIGRGLSTFIPGIYRTLDNQFLATIVESGVIGLAALALFLLAPIVLSVRAALQVRTRYLRSQALSIAAGVTTALLLAFTFDEFGFQMAFGMVCLLLGAAAGVWRVSRAVAIPQQQTPTTSAVLLNRRARTIVAVAALAIVAIGGVATLSARGEFEAKGSVVLRVLQSGDANVYDQKVEAPGLSDVVRYVMDSRQARADLASASVTDYSVAVGTGSLAPLTDVMGYGDLMWFAARASTAGSAKQNADLVRSKLAAEVGELQSNQAIPSDVTVRADSFTDTEVFETPVHRPAALLGVAALAGLGALLLGVALRGIAAMRLEPMPTSRKPERSP
jgi:O-antigen ligase